MILKNTKLKQELQSQMDNVQEIQIKYNELEIEDARLNNKSMIFWELNQTSWQSILQSK
jgi:hypothetical protein